MLEKPESPFRIDICWKYEKILSETRHHKTLAVWKPVLNTKHRKQRQNKRRSNRLGQDLLANVMNFQNSFFLGYLGLTNDIDPNDNIPTILVRPGTVPDAFRAPQKLRFVTFFFFLD